MIPPQPDLTWPDEDLVRECLAGNERAWTVLIGKYQKLVYSIPVKYQLPPEEAADIFQAVWTDLLRDLGRINRVEGLRSWLATAAARRCLLHKRRRQRRLEMEGLDAELPDGSPNPAALHLEAEKEQMLREALRRLPERCRRMVEMLFFEQPPRPYEEVARDLGLAVGSIGFIRGRCLGKLRALLEEMGW